MTGMTKSRPYPASDGDITELKRAEEELSRALEAARMGTKAKSDFLARMSHEIRTPMNAILGMSEIVLRSRLDPEQQDCMKTLRSAAGNLLYIINDILDLSKVEAGKMELAEVDFNLRETLADTFKTLAVQAADKKLSLDLDVAEDIPAWLWGDQAKLRQILVNLVGNAIKFTKKGGIEIQVDYAGLHGRTPRGKKIFFQLAFTVKDTGIGIPHKMQAEIFTPFNQADTSTSRKYGGTGLGLTITRSLIERMGGDIRLESKKGKGSRFRFTLPFRLGRGSKADSGIFTEDALETSVPLSLLLVEDNPYNIKVARKLLQKLGHRILVAKNGKQALRRLAAEPFDAVLMDVEMPEMDGMEATRRLRAGEAGGGKPGGSGHRHDRPRHGRLCAKVRRGRHGRLPQQTHFPQGIGRGSKQGRKSRRTRHVQSRVPPGQRKSPEHRGRPGTLRRDKELYRQVCAAFPAISRNRMLEFRQAMEKNDFEKFALLAHSCKNECGLVGADAGMKIADRLYQAAKAKDRGAMDGLLPSLETELERVLDALARD